MIKDSNRQYYVYLLTEPGVDMIGYIGQTDNIKTRLRKHIYDSKTEKKKHNKNCKWIRNILSNNKLPVLTIVDECLAKDADELETYYIAYHKSIGWKLTNSTNGGQNGFLYTKERLEQIRNNATKTRTIYGVNIKTKEVTIFTSAVDVQIKLNFTVGDRMMVIQCCEHKNYKKYTKSVKGYVFVYEDEFKKSTIEQLLSYSDIYKFSKAVLKYSLEGKFIAEFKNKREAAISVDGSARMIKEYCLCSPRHKNYKGFQWRWKESDNFSKDIGRNHNISNIPYKAIEQQTIDGDQIKQFKNFNEASSQTGCNKTGIIMCCSNTQKTCGGFKWIKIN